MADAMISRMVYQNKIPILAGCGAALTLYTLVWLSHHQNHLDEGLSKFEASVNSFEANTLQSDEVIRRSLIFTEAHVNFMQQNAGSMLSRVEHKMEAGVDPHVVSSTEWQQLTKEAIANPEQWQQMLEAKARQQQVHEQPPQVHSAAVNSPDSGAGWEQQRARQGYVPIEGHQRQEQGVVAAVPAGGGNAMPEVLRLVGAETSPVRYSAGWWTYEVMARQFVRQFHPGDAEFKLGVFQSATMEGRAYVEHYAMGDYCLPAIGSLGATTGNQQQRQTKVRWECGTVPFHPPIPGEPPEPQTALTQAAGILEIQEPRECSYLIIIRTSKLC